GVVGGGVLVRGVVAAADVAAAQADPVVEPDAAAGEAVLAAGHLVGQLGDLDLVQVAAARAHRGVSSLLVSSARASGGAAPVIGSQTWKVVPSGLVSKLIEPSWRSSTI